MSLARRCNRCHGFFDPLDSPGQMARFANPIFQTSNDIREQVRGEVLDKDCGPSGIIDLCPTCSIMFKEFMNPSESFDSITKAMHDGLERFREIIVGIPNNKPTPTFPKTSEK